MESADEDTDHATPIPAPGFTAPTHPILSYGSGAGSHEPWVHIWRAGNYLEANLAVGKLAEAGLRARVDMENAAVIGSWAGGGPGGANVQALERDAPAARAILKEIEDAQARRRNASAVSCPKCGHAPAKRRLHPARQAFIYVGGLMIVIVIFSKALALASDVLLPLLLAMLAACATLFLMKVTPRWSCPVCKNYWSAPDPVVDEEEPEEEEDSHPDD